MIFNNFKEEWLSNVRKDVMAGKAVAFALIPEAIAFSMIAGVNPMTGLSAWLRSMSNSGNPSH